MLYWYCWRRPGKYTAPECVFLAGRAFYSVLLVGVKAADMGPADIAELKGNCVCLMVHEWPLGASVDSVQARARRAAQAVARASGGAAQAQAVLEAAQAEELGAGASLAALLDQSCRDVPAPPPCAVMPYGLAA